MPWLLDTNAWITHLKNPGGPVERRLVKTARAEIRLCSVVKAELWHGAQRYGRRERRLEVLANLFGQLVSLPFDDAAAWRYAALKHDLEMRGQLIGPNDLLIAATCLAADVTLVTANEDEFRRVPGLRVENWTVAEPAR